MFAFIIHLLCLNLLGFHTPRCFANYLESVLSFMIIFLGTMYWSTFAFMFGSQRMRPKFIFISPYYLYWQKSCFGSFFFITKRLILPMTSLQFNWFFDIGVNCWNNVSWCWQALLFCFDWLIFFSVVTSPFQILGFKAQNGVNFEQQLFGIN